MAFIVKLWENQPSTDTPINAEALMDTELRVTNYTDEEVSVVADRVTALEAKGIIITEEGEAQPDPSLYPAGTVWIEVLP
jgi:hypothetical protein